MASAPTLRFATALLLLTTACASPKPERTAPPAADVLAPLRAFEESRLKETDFARLPPSDRAFGPDPYAIQRVPGQRAFVGVLRGRDAVVLLGEDLRELDRAEAPGSPSGVAVDASGQVFVVGDQRPEVLRFRIADGKLEAAEAIPLPRGVAARDVAVGPENVLYVAEEHAGRLLAIPLDGGKSASLFAGRGAFRIARVGSRVIVDALLDHTLTIFRVDAHGMPSSDGIETIRHDGPIWGLSSVARGEEIVIAAGGIEDHPLDRREGSFGFIDSFAFVYRVGPDAVERRAVVNVGELGVVTPKALALEEKADGSFRLMVTGTGGERAVAIVLDRDLAEARPEPAREVPPGSAALAATENGFALANPLLDAWVFVPNDGARPRVVPVPDAGARRSDDVLLGEALFFTTRMAPWNKTEGRLSRFTCEACHFEGYVDGRTHHTGRGDVRATTKPLLGLFNNRPHFSRALDPDLTAVAHNEFRVAGAKSDHDPWFSLSAAEAPWAPPFASGAKEIDALALRRSLMAFLMRFTHRPNPSALRHARFDDRERRGAEVFADRCETCHSARLRTDDAGSRVPFERWESLVLSREGAIVWARDGLEKTGVLPYVSPDGARPPSLRRLFKKQPYFTNGSAKAVRDVLDGARFGKGGFFHAEAPPGAHQKLEASEKDALEAFLELL